ncbi:MAG: DUF512 domain-containing protein, partial [Vallitaleaceae bacterium]|nr:DUF512 domain-containing protein [Vallitaleaceae bacterium]
KHREGLAPLLPFEKEDAIKLLKTVEKWQNTLYNTHGTHFIHLGDEFYFLAGQDMPKEESYDGYLQLENGVGMTRLLIDEFMECYNEMKPVEKKRKISIVTGQLIAPVMNELMAQLKHKCPHLEVTIFPIINHFFGERITVSGLLTGTDILEQLRDEELGECVLLPNNLLRNGEEVLLDDLTLTELEQSLGKPIVVVGTTGEELIQAVIG